MLFSQTVKERSEGGAANRIRSELGVSPENYFALLVPAPAFDRQGTPSLAAFPQPVKDFDPKSGCAHAARGAEVAR